MPDRRLMLALGVLGLGAWCGWVSGFHTDTAAATVTWIVSTAFVVGADVVLWRRRADDLLAGGLTGVAEPWPRPARGGARPALWGLAPWIVLLVIAAAWDALGIDTGRHQAHLTLSALAQTFRPLHAALLLVWIGVGIGYGVARARRPDAAPAEQTLPGPGVLCAAGLPFGHTAPALLLPSNRPIGVVFWTGVAATAVVIDLVARRTDGTMATSGELIRFVTTSPIANALVIVAWGFAGYHLFAR